MGLDRGKGVASVKDLLDKYGTMTLSAILKAASDELKDTSTLPRLLGEVAADLESALKDFARKK